MSGETEDQVSGWTTDTLHSHMVKLLAAYQQESQSGIASLKELMEAYREGDKTAVDKAFAAASELAKSHNDLLRKMEKAQETYVAKDSIDSRFKRIESWQAKVTGGVLVVAAVGLANFVKLWTG